MRRWWLERFSPDEIRELAAGLSLWLDDADAETRDLLGAAA
jgi:hypothetical protein